VATTIRGCPAPAYNPSADSVDTRVNFLWDEPFDTDQEALDAVMKVIEQDGIRSFLDHESAGMHRGNVNREVQASPSREVILLHPK
jgi:hypothetical protein